MAAELPARFRNEEAARKHLESIQWPDGPVCPHCGVINEASRIKGGRKGLMFCNACRMQFSVTVGTVFERSHVPLHTWLYATHLLCSSKKGISSHQLSRMLGVSYKTAWFMSHRVRAAMAPAAGAPIFWAEGVHNGLPVRVDINKPTLEKLWHDISHQTGALMSTTTEALHGSTGQWPVTLPDEQLLQVYTETNHP